MEELNLDPNDPNFNENEMLTKFQEIADDKERHFFERDRFTNLIKILGEHTFWDK